MIVEKIRAFLSRSSFIRDVLTLMTGTSIAQVIPLLFSPIISRIYSPSDMAVFAVYMSIVSIFGSFITFKYEYAILLPEKDTDAINLMGLAIILALLLSTVLSIIFGFYGKDILYLISNKKIAFGKWFYFIPLAILISGILNSLNFWWNRKEKYKVLAISRVGQSSGMVGTQLLLGFSALRSIGLVLGEMTGRIISVFYLSVKTLRNDIKVIRTINIKSLKEQFKRYINFPKYTLPADLINVVSNQIPVFALGGYFTANILGNYSLMDRVLGAPISLIGKSILDVFKQRASNDFIKNGNCRKIFLKTFKMLVLASAVPTLILFFFAPVLFTFVFGDNWEPAGEYARIMSLLFFFRFTSSPLSYMFFIAEKQNYDLLWQIVLICVIVASFIMGIHYNNVKIALVCYAVSYSFMYLIYLIISYNLSKGNLNKPVKL